MPERSSNDAEVRDVRVEDGAIRLGQFLKLADLAETGKQAKELLEAGLVKVNDDVDTRRGRQLAAGDVVQVAGRRARVA